MQKGLYLVLCYATGLASAISVPDLTFRSESLGLFPRSETFRTDLSTNLFSKSIEGVGNFRTIPHPEKRLVARGSSQGSGSTKGSGIVGSHAVAPSRSSARSPPAPSGSQAASPSRNGVNSPTGVRNTQIDKSVVSNGAASGGSARNIGKSVSQSSSGGGNTSSRGGRAASPGSSGPRSPGSPLPINSLLTVSERLAALRRSNSDPVPINEHGLLGASLPSSRPPSSRSRPGPRNLFPETPRSAGASRRLAEAGPPNVRLQPSSSRGSIAESTSTRPTRFLSAGSDNGSRVSGGTRISRSSDLMYGLQHVRGHIAGASQANTFTVEPDAGTLRADHVSSAEGSIGFSMRGYQRVKGTATNFSPDASAQLTATSSNFAEARIRAHGGSGMLRANLPGAGRSSAVVTGNARSFMQVANVGTDRASVTAKFTGEGDVSVEANDIRS